MANYKSHAHGDRAIYIFVAVAFAVIAFVLCALMTQWFNDWNPFCWFGHKNNDAGVCQRCGHVEEKQEQKDEGGEVAFIGGKHIRFANAAADDLSIEPYASGSHSEVLSGVTNDWKVNLYLTQKDDSNDYIADSCKVYFMSSNGNKKVIFTGDGLGFGMDITCDVSSLIGAPDIYPGQEYTVYVVWTGRVYTGGKDSITGEKNYTTPYTTKAFNIGTITFPDITALPEDPVKEGYTFTGWYTDEACTNKYTQSYVTGDMTLYAGWKANTYTVNFAANGGEGSMDSATLTYDVDFTLPENTFTYDRHNFVGWRVGSDDAEVTYAVGDKVKNLTAEDGGSVTIYAVWELGTYTVHYDANGGEGSIADQILTIGETNDLTANNGLISREGYNFKGWAKTINGSVEFVDGASVTDLVPDGDITLYAVWEIIKCKVTFVVDGEVYSTYVCDYGTKLSELLDQKVNPAFLRLGKKMSADRAVTSNIDVELEKTALGEQVAVSHYNTLTVVSISLCAAFVLAIVVAGFVMLRKKSKG